jgi:tungstate transport system substrate-binding protein
MIAHLPAQGFKSPVLRRLLALVFGALMSALLILPVSARADNSSTLTIVGTSDVQDSRLVPDLLTPAFKTAFPQFTLKYVSLGTGAAITQAEEGNASMLLVHAPSLENQFVQQGFSAEKFGRAIFWGDYVMLGATSDPAAVGTNASHDIVAAFKAIAAAGAAGHADFVSRANTSGTAVQEHQIWALAAGTPGLTLCTVSQANGGGDAPSTASGPCPSTPTRPPWYHGTGLTQAPNVENANTCNYPNALAAGHNDCYVFTDRGTFDCLTDAKCSGESAVAEPTNLKIVTRNNSKSATGGQDLLVNTFHMYALSPAKFAGNPNVQINSTAADDFLNFITSPGLQAQLKGYLGATHDPPFIADAAPALTAGRLPGKATAGKAITVRGSLANVVPGTPPLNGVKVTVEELSGLAGGIPIASTRTTSTGAYALRFTPSSTGRYQLFTGEITKIENSTLNPVFGDLLQPAATSPARISVQSVVNRVRVTALPGRIDVTGAVVPGSQHVKGTVNLLVRRVGAKGGFRKVASSRLGTADSRFAISASSSAGKWLVEVRFQDPGQVLSTTTRSTRILVPSRSTGSVTAKSVKVSRGRLTVGGTVGPAPTAAGTKVELLALDVGALAGARKTAFTAASSSVSLRVVATATVPRGAKKFTLHARLRRGQRWALQLGYLPGGGVAAAFGGIRTVRLP